MGLYIQMNCAWQYLEDFEINVARRLFRTLERLQLHTRPLCVKNNLPIIIKSFDSFNLEYFRWEYDPQEHFPHAETIINPVNGTKRHQIYNNTKISFKDIEAEFRCIREPISVENIEGYVFGKELELE